MKIFKFGKTDFFFGQHFSYLVSLCCKLSSKSHISSKFVCFPEISLEKLFFIKKIHFFLLKKWIFLKINDRFWPEYESADLMLLLKDFFNQHVEACVMILS